MGRHGQYRNIQSSQASRSNHRLNVWWSQKYVEMVLMTRDVLRTNAQMVKYATQVRQCIGYPSPANKDPRDQ